MIFAVVLTVVYFIYYTVIIVHDLYGKPKEKKADAETFDVSDMEEEDESVSVDESDGGFSVGGNEYETSYEAKPTEEMNTGRRGEKVDVAEKIQAGMAERMEVVKPSFSDPVYTEQLRRLMVTKGLNGTRPRVRVTTIKDEI